MCNKALLLASANKLEPHVVLTIGHLFKNEDYYGYNKDRHFGSLDKIPYWKSNLRVTGRETESLGALYDMYYDDYLGTELLISTLLGSMRDSYRVTRVDTKEVFEMSRMDSNFFSGANKLPLFHDLNAGDTVGLIFDPPPDGYE